MTHTALLLLLAGIWASASASAYGERSLPTVMLDSATVTGISSGSVNQFLGIQFAQPPTGNLRFQLPQCLSPYNTSFSATAYGLACLQQAAQFPAVSGLPAETLEYLTGLNSLAPPPSGEDCLTLNVVAPADATPDSKLPVVVWIYGGGFEEGASSPYNGTVIVDKAISLGVPAIYVSMNYRMTHREQYSLNAFGFLASQEVKDAGVGNLGLRDQRLALYWVQKYICAFGGDPRKVTIWGESAGAASVGLQMVANDGNSDGLFRAAFMQSGSPLSIGDISGGQKYYDALVSETGCSSATDTLQCLREVPYETLLDAVNQSPNIFSYQSLALAWQPRADGVFLTDNPQKLVQQGFVADVPFVTGDCDDEGTLFSFSTLNVTTDTQFEEYFQTYWFPNVPSTTIKEIMQYYPANISQGSPFDTGTLNAFTPQFKRIAALQGDAAFQAPRRLLLHNRSGKQALWTYTNKRFKTLPYLGSVHGSDIFNVFGGQDMTSYLVRFVSNLDPNGGTDLYWPQYTTAEPNMLEFLDGSIPQALTEDTYRADAMAFLNKVFLAHPL
ncbi:alpha beta-hydrolase [Paxillus ammoniavirescens]|nr:alpha beta-hydrolase [Paxillus ammoniavirescens]